MTWRRARQEADRAMCDHPSIPPVVGGPGLDVTVGPKLASGRDADLFDLDGGRVLRRNRRGRSQEREAAVLRYAREHGYPVPPVYAASGPDLVLERVDGLTMLADLARRPWMLWRHARLLAWLHRRLHTIPGPAWLPPFPPDLGRPGGTDTASAPDSPGAVERERRERRQRDDGPARSVSESGTSGPDVLLHLDLHPDNVLLSPHGPVVIDWTNARRGPGAADEALSWVIMATSEIDGPLVQRRLADLTRRLFVAAFLRQLERRAVLARLPAAARYRLADPNVRDGERRAIVALLRRADAAG